MGCLRLWYVPSRRCWHNQPPIQTLGRESLISFNGGWHSSNVETTHCWGNEVHPVVLFLLKFPLKVWAWFPPDFGHSSFPFVNFALSLFAVRNHSHEYGYLGDSKHRWVNHTEAEVIWKDRRGRQVAGFSRWWVVIGSLDDQIRRVRGSHEP